MRQSAITVVFKCCIVVKVGLGGETHGSFSSPHTFHLMNVKNVHKGADIEQILVSDWLFLICTDMINHCKASIKVLLSVEVKPFYSSCRVKNVSPCNS